MSTIRRQSIISSFVVYFGFALGFINTYLFTREGGFATEQYGLTAVYVAIAQLMFSVANVGMSAYVTKFFPYYKAHLPPEQRDQMTIALVVPLVGFILVIGLSLLFKDVVINKIFANSPELPVYYYWLFPFGFGYTIFMILDAYAWQLHKAVLSSFLKEVAFRFLVTLLIVLTTLGLITDFDVFIKLFSFLYVVLAVFLIFHFRRHNRLHFTRRISIVTRRFRKQILSLTSLVWGGSLVFSLASVVDTLLIAAILPNGMGAAGVFTFGQYIASLVQAPQRAVVAASTGPLSQAWRDKDFGKLNRIYQRSSINLLLFSCAMFSLIWLNFDDAVITFGLQAAYLDAKWVFFFFGLTRIIDMGTGVNAQIISTSTHWRFEFMTGLVLLGTMLPLNFFLTREMGLIGPAIAGLVSFFIYNAIRYTFLLRKFQMQPFNAKTCLAVLLAGASFCITYFLYRNVTGLHWMILRSLTFMAPFAAGVIWLRISPDVLPVWQTVRKRLGFQ